MNQLTIQPSAFNPTTKNSNTMEVNQYFSFARFGHLLRRELSQNKQNMLLVAAAIILILGINSLAWGYNREHGYHQFAYPFFLIFGGFILTSFSFTEMNTAYGKQFYLHLPASNVEKFFSKWLLTGVGYLIIFTLLYFIFSFIGNGLSQAIFGFDHGVFNFFTQENGFFIQTYLAGQTISLLGAVYFRKFAIFKTILSAVFTVIGLGLLSVLCFRLVMFDLFEGLYNFTATMYINSERVPVEPSKDVLQFFRTHAESYIRLVGLWIIPAVLLIIGYFKMKETEL